MQKGRTLERAVEKLFGIYRQKGIHCHKNNALRNHVGKYLLGEPFDYEILTNPAKVFDAKECGSVSLNFNTAKELKQLKNLYDCEQQGHDAFFLIYFYNEPKLVRIKASKIKEILETGRKSVKSGDCEGVEILNV